MDLKNKKGIDVKKINYFSPRGISQITRHIDELEDELGITITITDQAQFCVMAANNECSKIFKEFVATMIGSLESEDDKSLMLDYPALYLSAWYRYENKTENIKTIANITDNLIIWALRNTDPDQNIFMTDEQIYTSIEQEFPSAKTTIKSIFHGRLKHLNQQRTEFFRQSIQKHKQGYCLPVETREDFKNKNRDSEEILLLAKASFIDRIDEDYTSDRKKEIIELLLHSIKHVFTKQGMKLTKNINDVKEDTYDDINLKDAIEYASNDLESHNFNSKEQTTVSKVLRKVFANPTTYEQEYLIRSSYLYIMHYVMHNNMDVISYFEERTKRLNLVVHSDIIILAISEQYLPQEGQHYRNMLSYLRTMGASLLITEEALTEVYMNLRIASYEYNNNIRYFENHFTIESIRYLPVLMTRAYMYSKLDGLVDSWEKFINNFCTPKSLLYDDSRSSVKEELKIYLTDKFALDILTTKELESKIDIHLASALTEIVKPHKKKIEIAKHVSNVNIYVSTMRHINKEISGNPFGYQTYWLTREKTVYAIAEKFFNDNNLGARLIMRPEFIMQQIMFTPDPKSVAKSYTSTFPTALGIQMSQQLSGSTFKGLMLKLSEISKLDDSRAKAILNDVIQVAAEKTKLTHDMDVYAQEELPENGVEGMNGYLKTKLEDIIKDASDRVKERAMR